MVLLIIIFFTILNGQSNVENIVIGNKGYNFGGVFNIYDNGIDMETFANIENKYGVYGNIWFGQIDYYTNTNLISNYSLGISKEISRNISLDLGLGQNSTFENEIKNSTEIYIGLDMNYFSIYAFFEDKSLNFEAWFKPNFVIPNLDFLFYSSFEKGAYEINIDISRHLNEKLITGLILGFENFKETFNYEKGENSKTYTVTNYYNRVFASIYLGLLYN